MLLRRTVSEIQPFKDLGFELPILTLRGHSRSKVKVNLERSHMVSYAGRTVYTIESAYIEFLLDFNSSNLSVPK